MLSAQQQERVGYFLQLLEKSPRLARKQLAELPAGYRLVYNLRSPYVHASLEELAAERARIRTLLDEFLEQEFDPAHVLGAAAQSPVSMAWLYFGELDRELREPYGRILLHCLQKVAPDLCESMPKRKPGKQRIGYVSPQLRDANSSRWALPYAKSHPASDCDVYAFNVGPRADHVTAQWKAVCHEQLNLSGDVVAMGREIRARDLDVLVFTDVGIDGIADVLGSMRLARQQCALWGGPCSTGLPNMDIFFVGEWMAGEDQEYTEKRVLLPGAGVYYERSLVPPSAPGVSLGGMEPLFYCCQNLPKCHPKWDGLLAQLSQQLPKPLVFTASPVEGVTEKLMARFSKAGVWAQFVPPVPEPVFGAMLDQAALNVDTLSYNGGITSILAMAHQTPTLTMPGTLMRDRFTRAFLDAAGLKEMISTDEKDYLDKAMRFAELKVVARESNMSCLFGSSAVLDSFNRNIVSLKTSD